MAKKETCPECGAVRPADAKLCPRCRYDFESLTHRYRDTEYAGAAQSAATYGTPSVAAAPRLLTPPLLQRRWLRSMGRIVLFYAGLAVLAGASLWTIRSGMLPDKQLPQAVVLVAMLAMFVIAGIASRVIPGRYARGVGKGSLLGFIGWLGVAMILFQAGGLLLASLGYPTGVIEHTVAAITGASLLRVLLLLVP